LVIENAGTTGQCPLTYVFEIAGDTTFATKVFVRQNVAPTASAPLPIVECERNKYGRSMSTADLVGFLFAVARSLNRHGIAGSPFGVLRKESGISCNGCSCDMLCAGQGSAQSQWDVLIDEGGANVPVWSGPHTAQDGIRVDSCEIRP
jgi:hypothetical protein